MVTVAPEYAVESCAKPLDCGLTLPVHRRGAELDGDALERLEGMREEKQLRFGVESSSLNAFTIERVADFQATVCFIAIAIGRHPDSGTRGSLDEREGHHRAGCLLVQTALDLRGHTLGRRDARIPEIPKLPVAYGLNEIVVVGSPQRLENDGVAMQRDRTGPAHQG